MALKYWIVLPDNVDDVTAYAAGELKSYLWSVGKVTARIVSEREADGDGRYFYLGNTQKAIEKGLIPTEKEVNYYGFTLKTEGDSFFIVGARPRGTLYGVYEYIERVLGVRFLALDETYLPKTCGEIFPVLNETQAPDFQLRSYLTGQVISHGEKSAYFAAKLRMNMLHCPSLVRLGGSINVDFYDERHNTLDLVQPAVWQESHPEFFNVGEDGKVSEICWTNGIKEDGTLDESMDVSVAKVLIEQIKERALLYPTSRYFMIGQVDASGGYCQCEKCKRVIEKYGAISAPIIRMMNVVTEKIVEWAKPLGREINLATFVYSYTEKPPVFFDENENPYVADETVFAHPNLCIRIAPMSQNVMYSVYDKRQDEAEGVCRLHYKGWSYLAKRFMIWEYTTNFLEYFWHYPSWFKMNENARYYKEIGTDFVMYQGQTFDEMCFEEELKCYLASKVLWNVNADVERLKEEFLNLYYKESASEVKEVLNLLDGRAKELIENKTKNFGMHMLLHNHGAETNPEFYPKELLEKAVKILDKRMETLTDETLIKRLKKVQLTPLKMLLFNEKHYYTDEKEVKALAEKFCDICAGFGFERLGERREGGTLENGIVFCENLTQIRQRYNLLKNE